jgi:glycosyltransferase involved in cell wall biosynthesis
VVGEPRPGYGQACQRGLAALAALDRPPDVLAFLDADDYQAPGQLGELLHPIQAGLADMVVGVRTAPAGHGVRWHAALGNRLVLTVLRVLYGDTTRDMGPFRAIRWECLQDLRLDDPNYGWYVQMQVRALRRGWKVTSVPVSFQRRTHGRSKVSGSLTGSVAAGWVMLRTLFREVLQGTRGGAERDENQLRADTSS